MVAMVETVSDNGRPVMPQYLGGAMMECGEFGGR